MNDPAVGARRLAALVNGLPADAATWRDGTLWTARDHMLAAVVETVDHWGRQHAVLLGMKQQDLPDPLTIERPERDDTED